MRVQAIRTFRDLEMECWRNRGETFAVDTDRGDYLVGLGLATVVEEAEKPKPAPRRRRVKTKEK